MTKTETKETQGEKKIRFCDKCGEAYMNDHKCLCEQCGLNERDFDSVRNIFSTICRQCKSNNFNLLIQPSNENSEMEIPDLIKENQSLRSELQNAKEALNQERIKVLEVARELADDEIKKAKELNGELVKELKQWRRLGEISKIESSNDGYIRMKEVMELKKSLIKKSEI